MTHHQTWNIRVVPGRVAPAKAVGGETPLDHTAARQTRPPQEGEGWRPAPPGAPGAELAAPTRPADAMPETKPRGDDRLRYHANSGHQGHTTQGRPRAKQHDTCSQEEENQGVPTGKQIPGLELLTLN